MTAADQDPVRAFRAAIGHHLDRQLNTTQAVVALIHAAVTHHGWTPQQLADECGRDLADTYKPGGVITERLRKAATHPPVGQRAAVFGPKRPFCSDECRDNQGLIVDPETRLPVGKCPCRTTPQEAKP